MRKPHFISMILALILFSDFSPAENVVLVIIDGARYSETFGDENRTFIPQMDSLSQYGTILDQFYNDSLTYTSRAVPALWCGAWTGVRDTIYNGSSTQYTLKPSLFEYFRRQTASPAEKAVYVLKYVPSLWLPSFHPEYGPDYWPAFISSGTSDRDVLDQALQVMHTSHPQLLLVYLADVDHNGHLGDWDNYTQAISVADSIVAALWQTIQQDSVYANNTTLLVTNDHGRHDDAHGGFSGHGDGCEGCRHIMFLALGPQIQQGQQFSSYRRTPDFAVTAAHILAVTPQYATGDIIEELFIPIATDENKPGMIPENIRLYPIYPNPFNATTLIQFDLYRTAYVTLSVYTVTGQLVATLIEEERNAGRVQVRWNGKTEEGRSLSSGVYFMQLRNNESAMTRKIVLLE